MHFNKLINTAWRDCPDVCSYLILRTFCIWSTNPAILELIGKHAISEHFHWRLLTMRKSHNISFYIGGLEMCVLSYIFKTVPVSGYQQFSQATIVATYIKPNLSTNDYLEILFRRMYHKHSLYFIRIGLKQSDPVNCTGVTPECSYEHTQ